MAGADRARGRLSTKKKLPAQKPKTDLEGGKAGSACGRETLRGGVWGMSSGERSSTNYPALNHEESGESAFEPREEPRSESLKALVGRKKLLAGGSIRIRVGVFVGARNAKGGRDNTRRSECSL